MSGELWTVADIARHLGVLPSTVSGYRARRRLPECTRFIGRSPVWRAEVIKRWHAGRSRAGVGGRRRKAG